MTAVKNLIFDLGGVLLNVDYHKTADAFKQLGAHQFDEMYSQATANHLFEALETGEITETDFYSEIGKYCEKGTTNEQLRAAWNAILIDFRLESLQALDSLKEKYQLYLLSNTNAIHLTAFNKMLQVATGKGSLDDYFIKSYYSHQVNKRKPYVETYQWVLEDSQLLASETLFIDDSENNIKGAAAAGLQTHWLLPDERIERLSL